jgi:glycosyltransferase involved in cell wall biosynthesis
MNKIAVVLPVYNGMKFLESNVSSVLKQTYTDFIFLIADDCSTDGSWEYLTSLNDSRIQLYRNERNSGLFHTLNFLCKEANTELIKIWSQDDIMYSNCLVETVTFHNRFPDISFSYSDREHIDELGQIIASADLIDFTPAYISRELHDKIALFTGSIAGNIANVAIVSEKLKEVGYFDETMTIAADFDMWVKLTERYNIGRINKKLIQLRTHSGQLSKAPEYYIRHLVEEKKILRNLMNRVDKDLKDFGRKNIKWRKGPLYFSFLLQTIKRGNWKTTRRFYNELSEIDNIFVLTLRWMALKLKTIAGLSNLRKDNRFLFDQLKIY